MREEIFNIERLKVDSDGESDQAARIFIRMILAPLIFGLVVGLPFGLVVGLVVGSVASLIVSFIVSLVVGLIVGPIAGFIVGLISNVYGESYWNRGSGMGGGCIFALGFELVYGLGLLLVVGLSSGLIIGSKIGLLLVLIVALVIGPILGLTFDLTIIDAPWLKGLGLLTLVFGPAGWVAVGLARLHKLLGKLSFGLIYGLALGLIYGLVLGHIVGLITGVLAGLIAGLVSFERTRIQYVVLRLIYWRAGFMPWNYRRFLDYAVERILLRKVGKGYIFTHQLLQEYFTTLESRPNLWDL